MWHWRSRFQHSSRIWILANPQNTRLGFVIAGGLYLAIGSIVIVIMKNRLGRGIVPERTINELGRDKEWIQKEL